MKQPKPVTIDFETEAIDQRPCYPPKPVGVSIKYPGRKARYYAWAHPEGNNCTEVEAKSALEKAYQSGDLLFHNAKFDLDVAETHLGLKLPHWAKIHDTMILLFLFNPHLKSFGLKPAAEELLHMPPTERDEVFDWLVKNKVITRAATRGWGAHICKAPGDLVGTYADGDVIRTEALFKHCWPAVNKAKMLTAYDRERELLPILLEMEREGIPVDLQRLTSDVAGYRWWQAKIDLWVYKMVGKQFKIDSGPELVSALINAQLINTDKLGKTEKGAWKVDKESLDTAVTDNVLSAVLSYRASLGTCMGTFMEPWNRMAQLSNGRIFTQWNQIKSFDRKAVGAVTGRLSSTPNFQNIPNEFKPLWKHEKKSLPALPLGLKGLPALPRVRSYVTAPKGMVLIDRDYSQQEPRILGHFEAGALMTAYNANPWLDMHDEARAELEKAGMIYPRKLVKNINLGLIYGMGVGLLAQKNGTPYEETKELKNAILQLYPGLKEMQKDMKMRAMNNLPIRTWGGRVYYVEPPKMVPDRWNPGEFRAQTFEYKLVNVLVQGSAADCTKEAVLRYHRNRPEGHKLVLTVHDELMALCPDSEWEAGMEALRMAMEGIEFDVPMLSEGKASTTTWADMVDTDKKGKEV